jgi:hypothetical protein
MKSAFTFTSSSACPRHYSRRAPMAAGSGLTLEVVLTDTPVHPDRSRGEQTNLGACLKWARRAAAHQFNQTLPLMFCPELGRNLCLQGIVVFRDLLSTVRRHDESYHDIGRHRKIEALCADRRHSERPGSELFAFPITGLGILKLFLP